MLTRCKNAKQVNTHADHCYYRQQSCAVCRMQYDQLSQQQLSFLFFFKFNLYITQHCVIINLVYLERFCKNFYFAHTCCFHTKNIVGTSCDLSMNSKCYRKFHSQLTWYSASNECLSRGGSLAVFTDIERPSDNSQLTNWLNSIGTDKTYWIGLVTSWWKTSNEGNTWRYRDRLWHE